MCTAKVEHRLRVRKRLGRDDAMDDQARIAWASRLRDRHQRVEDRLGRAGRSAQRLIPYLWVHRVEADHQPVDMLQDAQVLRQERPVRQQRQAVETQLTPRESRQRFEIRIEQRLATREDEAVRGLTDDAEQSPGIGQ